MLNVIVSDVCKHPAVGFEKAKAHLAACNMRTRILRNEFANDVYTTACAVQLQLLIWQLRHDLRTVLCILLILWMEVVNGVCHNVSRVHCFL